MSPRIFREVLLRSVHAMVAMVLLHPHLRHPLSLHLEM
jgi:hypothetical protein